jgi:hypothetical protein
MWRLIKGNIAKIIRNWVQLQNLSNEKTLTKHLKLHKLLSLPDVLHCLNILIFGHDTVKFLSAITSLILYFLPSSVQPISCFISLIEDMRVSDYKFCIIVSEKIILYCFLIHPRWNWTSFFLRTLGLRKIVPKNVLFVTHVDF